MKRKALGKGLQSLIPADVGDKDKGDKVVEIDISFISPSKYQPRRKFDKEKLEELAQSIKNSGLIQPIVVAEEGKNKYSIIAGERRWRAAQLAGFKKIPAIVKKMDEVKKAEFAIIENIQRENLNPVEEAFAYKTLLENFKITQEELAKRLGKKRATIANTIRILNLPQQVLDLIEDGLLSLGHAKVLLGLKDEDKILKLSKEVVDKGLSVRSLEKKIASLHDEKKKEKQEDVFLKDASEKLTKSLGTKVSINGTQQKGSIVIKYHSKEQLEALFDFLKRGRK
ncbi:chromosome partitioning protein, ParB family [Thermotomaculum hydrothermale]|uniref:Chromosome partitioning protein, ParB family n=1 Tax=Thermotomaculum hydrothermale TaxID=981385 RepID=A0A7R6SZ48_9BACT|nr:ParB/RepB/Spo0J family partition protein [Thermotomaculum hydrothermale]BBB33479.1 chromosome partitioning protein, ParB family [Thermotomaculum hydrothermale]